MYLSSLAAKLLVVFNSFGHAISYSGLGSKKKISNASGYWMLKSKLHTIRLRSRPKLPGIVLAEQGIGV